MTDRELQERLRDWYAGEVPETERAPADLRAVIAAIPATNPAPLRPLVRAGDIRLLAVAAILLVGGAVAAGSGFLRLPSVVPPAPSEQAEVFTPAPAPSATPRPIADRPGPLVASIRYVGQGADSRGRLWVSGQGGQDARELLPGGPGEQYGRLSWSPDGSRMLYTQDRKLYVIDVDGTDPQLLDTGCVAPCDVDTDAAFSRDGTSIVFVRRSLDADGNVESSTIATLDLATGQVALLAATTSDSDSWPDWSPDGQRIVFSHLRDREDIGTLSVIDRNGENLREIGPAGLGAVWPGWSPDGSRIVFTGIGAGFRPKDVYTIRPDGSDVRRLTTDQRSSAATWQADGRLLFARRIVDGTAVGLWTMDADGANATVFIPDGATGIGYDEFPFVRAIRQPQGGPAIAAIAKPAAPAVSVGPPPPTPTPPELASGFSWTGTSLFKQDGPMGETATLLADGRVLVTSGCGTAAELYDPATGTFSPTGSLSVARGGATATLLRDGRVLVAGGTNCGSAGQDGTWASAELYDPATGTFRPTGSLTAPRSQHTATLLADGRVLIAGGVPGESASTGGIRLVSFRTVATDSFLATAEVYDPVTGTFSRTGSMSSPHRGHTSTLLKDGRVLVVGNGGEASPSGKIADLYDPSTGKFIRTGSMKAGRWLHTATLLPDGRVLILGGRTPQDSVRAAAELYDPRSGTFSSAGSMREGRQQHAATLLNDGRVLITGGYWSDGQDYHDLSSAELYDPGTGRSTSIGSMGWARNGHLATLLQDGRVLIVGGADIGRRGAVGVVAGVLYQP